MELRHLRYFVAIAEEMNFSRAAEKLNIAQPPLSQQIHDLEKELGTPLFDRSRRQISLTAAGAIFLQEAQQILAKVEEAILKARQAERGEIGRLAIGYIDLAMYELIPTALPLFRLQYPQVELVLHEMAADLQLKALETNQIDVGFSVKIPTPPNIASEIVRQMPFVAVLPENHHLAAKEQLALADLSGEDFIIFPRSFDPHFYDLIMRLCQQKGVRLNIVQEAPGVITTNLVATGIGISIIPESVQILRREGVVFRPLAEKQLYLEIVAMWQRDNKSPVLKAILQLFNLRSQP